MELIISIVAIVISLLALFNERTSLHDQAYDKFSKTAPASRAEPGKATLPIIGFFAGDREHFFHVKVAIIDYAHPSHPPQLKHPLQRILKEHSSHFLAK